MAKRSDIGTSGDSGEVAGAGGVVFRPSGEVLLLGHREGSWVFPKGHVDPGESPLEAALREVAEEAGVRAHCPDQAHRDETRYVNARGQARRITWFLLLTDNHAPALREALFPRGGFFTPEVAAAKLSFPEDRALLKRMLQRFDALQRRAP
jgi:diadenosine hexaphosphate hydrolase (ATP-forming)